MKVLLTGATGFIGSHVARELLRRKHQVYATLRPTSDRRRIRDIESDLEIHDGEMDLLPVEPDVAIPLAWYAVPGKYLHAPENEHCLEASRRLLSSLSCGARCPLSPPPWSSPLRVPCPPCWDRRSPGNVSPSC